MQVPRILPAMQSPEQPRARARSPFVAAFLSLLFPGLGHAYAGAYARAIGFASAPILTLALIGGIVLRADRLALLGFIVQPWVLSSIFILNLLALLYRILATVDAWRVVHHVNAFLVVGDRRLGRPRIVFPPASIAGLLAVVLVLSGAHVAVARYDLQAMAFVNCIFDASGTADCGTSAAPSGSPGTSASVGGSVSPSTSPSPPPTPASTAQPSATPLPPWDGKQRLNILLVGVDQRPNEGTFNTDTLMVVSIDPTTDRVAMFTLPRDTVDVPVPAGPANNVRNVFGSVYRGKINSWYVNNVNRSDLWPGSASTRGFTALKAILGELYGLDIRYYVEVNFDGFRQVVDALGGVTINVQMPVTDDDYPGETGLPTRVYIPSGPQHMTGSQALVYARSRHGSNDFDRGARQQRVLLSLREQTDIAAVLPKLDSLIAAMTRAVHTDIPVSDLPKLLSLAEQVHIQQVRSYIFAPPYYATENANSSRGYIIEPNVSRIRAAVKGAFTVDPAVEQTREAIAQEGALTWVLNGSGINGQSTTLARYLEFMGLQASAPNQAPAGPKPTVTTIDAYNGAETKFPQTIAYLEDLLGVKATPETDPAARADIIITTTAKTPVPTPPALP